MRVNPASASGRSPGVDPSEWYRTPRAVMPSSPEDAVEGRNPLPQKMFPSTTLPTGRVQPYQGSSPHDTRMSRPDRSFPTNQLPWTVLSDSPAPPALWPRCDIDDPGPVAPEHVVADGVAVDTLPVVGVEADPHAVVDEPVVLHANIAAEVHDDPRAVPDERGVPNRGIAAVVEVQGRPADVAEAWSARS